MIITSHVVMSLVAFDVKTGEFVQQKEVPMEILEQVQFEPEKRVYITCLPVSQHYH